jgi:hypothetical protein
LFEAKKDADDAACLAFLDAQDEAKKRAKQLDAELSNRL